MLNKKQIEFIGSIINDRSLTSTQIKFAIGIIIDYEKSDFEFPEVGLTKDQLLMINNPYPNQAFKLFRQCLVGNNHCYRIDFDAYKKVKKPLNNPIYHK